MKRLKKDSAKDFRIEILEGKIRYITQAMEFRQAMLLKEKQKLRNSRRKKAY